VKVTQIRASAGRTMSFAGTCYANARPQLELHAELSAEDDPIEKLKELHQMAENLLEDQCDELLAFVHHRHAMRQKKLASEKKTKAPSIEATNISV
jgi:hypothetical protein